MILDGDLRCRCFFDVVTRIKAQFAVLRWSYGVRWWRCFVDFSCGDVVFATPPLPCPPHIGNLPIAANTIGKSRDHDKFPFAKSNKPHLKISFENLYFLDCVSQGFHYTHKQSLARVPLLGYREIIHTYPFTWTWSPISDPGHFALSDWRYILQ